MSYKNKTSWDSLEEMQHAISLFKNNVGSEEFYRAIEKELPSLFTRTVASKALGGLIAPRTFANIDCRGEGPNRVKINGKIMYEKSSFMQWLRSRENHI